MGNSNKYWLLKYCLKQLKTNNKISKWPKSIRMNERSKNTSKCMSYKEWGQSRKLQNMTDKKERKFFSDVGFLFVCCDYSWLIKELLWAYSRGPKLNWRLGRRRQRQRDTMEPQLETAGDRCAETLLVGHNLTVMHRLTEMGWIKM